MILGTIRFNAHSAGNPVSAYVLRKRASKILFIEFSPEVACTCRFHSEITIHDTIYHLRGMVRHNNTHFTCVVSVGPNNWIYLDDMNQQRPHFSNVNEIYRHYRSGWFFAIYVMDDETITTESYEPQSETLNNFMVGNISSKCKHKFEDTEVKSYPLRSKDKREAMRNYYKVNKETL